MTDEHTEGRGVQSIEVGVRILDALMRASEPLKLKEVAEASGIVPAQAHAYLTSFRRQAMVEQDPVTNLYRLGHFALQLSIARMRAFDPLRRAGDTALDLAARTRLTTALSVWGSFGATVVYIHEGADQIHINTRAGTVYSLTGTATGLVFAAHLPEHQVRDAIEAEAAEPASTRRVGARLQMAAIVHRLPRIREQGYATIDPPPVPEIHALASPVFDHLGQIRMVITLIGPQGVLDDRPQGRHVEDVLKAARSLNDQMGYVAPRSSEPVRPTTPRSNKKATARA